MYFNKINLIVLDVFIVYVYGKYIQIVLRDPTRLRLSFLCKMMLTVLLSVIIGTIIAAYNNRLFTNNTMVDIQRLINHCIVYITIPVLLRKSLISNVIFLKAINISMLVFTLAVGYSLFVAGLGSSAFYGNLFGATTVNLTITSAIAFYGLFLHLTQKGFLGIVLSFLAWLISLASLAKWNTMVITIIPILFYFIIIENVKCNSYKKYFFGIIITGMLLMFVLPNISNYLNTFSSIQGYSSFQNYLDSRVFRTATSDNMVNSGTLFNLGGKGMSDGARFIMWQDLLSRTMEAPIVGLGFGVRALDSYGFDVEDHSIFVFLISRFGFFMGLLVIYYMYRIVAASYKYFDIPENYLLKYIFLGITLNFLFQSSVGMIWGQIPVTLTLGILLSIMYGEVLKIKRNEQRAVL